MACNISARIPDLSSKGVWETSQMAFNKQAFPSTDLYLNKQRKEIKSYRKYLVGRLYHSFFFWKTSGN